MRKFVVLVIAITMGFAKGASAIGIADFVSAGISVVGKVGGAVIDKATEDSPEEMARKQEQQKLEREAKFNEVIAKIEERKDITPLEKEKLTRAAARSFGAAETISNLAVQQEIQRRAERDQMLSAGGIAGVVGNAAMNTPSAVMARADVMVKAGIPQAQSRAAIEGANDLMKTGRPQAQSKGAVDAAMISMNGGTPSGSHVPANIQVGGSVQDKAAAEASVKNAIEQNRTEIDKAKVAVDSAKPKELPTVAQPSNLTSLDRGRKVYVEFVGSQKLTDRLVNAFKSNGHQVVGSAAEADAIYQFDAEYAIAEEPNREGALVRVGQFVEKEEAIELKPKGASAKKMVTGFLFAMSGREMPKQQESGLYRQAALFVANRHADGKDMRVSARSSSDTYELAPMKLIDGVFADLLDLVGLPAKSQVAVSNNPLTTDRKDM